MNEPTGGEMTVAEFLQSQGFQRIKLCRNAANHYETTGSLNGRPITVIVDTGAGATVVALDLAQELELELEQMPTAGGGAGGVNLPIFKAKGGALIVGGIAPEIEDLIAMDLSHVNDGLVCKGAGPIDAILGADVFEAHLAVIDYGSSSLFLKV
jgi:hypothetical protein